MPTATLGVRNQRHQNCRCRTERCGSGRVPSLELGFLPYHPIARGAESRVSRPRPGAQCRCLPCPRTTATTHPACTARVAALRVAPGHTPSFQGVEEPTALEASGWTRSSRSGSRTRGGCTAGAGARSARDQSASPRTACPARGHGVEVRGLGRGGTE